MRNEENIDENIPLRNSNVVFFFLFSQRVQILKTEYKYG